MGAQPHTSQFDHLQQLLKELEYRRRTNVIESIYPATGLLRRDLYPKHMLTFAMGKYKSVRVVEAANRTGKTFGVGGYETTTHLIGEYPDWWPGRKFNRPVNWIASGVSKETTRDIVQAKLLGKPGELGTGLIPKRCLGIPRMRPNGNGAVDMVPVRHKSGLWSHLYFKSYEQGRESYEGTERDGVWLDEEPPIDVFTECVMRTMTTDGIVLVTYTPLKGITRMVREVDEMIKAAKAESRDDDAPVKVNITWDDVPHLSEKQKAKLLATTPPHTHQARALGLPALGEGAIYPVGIKDVLCKPFDIPKHWPRVYGLDVGWNRTAAVWGAWDKENDVVYLYSEHYRGKCEPVIHAAAIKARGDWIPGVVDKAARSSSQINGADLLSMYRNEGLKLHTTDITDRLQSVEDGIMAVLTRLSTGRLRVFDTMQNWQQEYTTYHRKESPSGDRLIIVKEDDHLMDAMRYLIVWGLRIAKVRVETYDPSPTAMTFGLYSEQ